MPRPVPVCVDVPAGAGLLRYGLEELFRGLGLEARWARRDEARVVVAREGRGLEAGDGALVLAVTDRALGDLEAPRLPGPGALGWVEHGGERWPVPVGPPGAVEARGDLVAAAAWWLAGLQERAVVARDVHGRFPVEASLQAALGDAPGGFYRPAVDAYRRALADALRDAGLEAPGRTWGGAPWAVAMTHDLDAVHTRRLRSGLGGLVRRLPAEALQRAFGRDRRRHTIGALRELGRRHGMPATWYLKPGRWAPEDLPVDFGERDLAVLRALDADGGEIGWHPGYGAHDHPGRLATEHARFVEAFGREPRHVRTHYLRWTAPTTPRLLEAFGCEVDSTLGFSGHEGFRRGTSHPFRLYDVETGRVSGLWEVPLSLMDTTLSDYRRIDLEEAARVVRRVFDGAREAGGVCVVLWHNQIGGDDRVWDARLDTLDHALGRASRDGARLGSLGGLLEAWLGGG